MTHVFVSYHHDDRAWAERLAHALEEAGLSVWWDRTIPAGQDFDQVIERALAETKVVVALWSRRSVQSRWVRNEAEEAAARNILVPVLIEAGVKIPLNFKRIQAADLVNWSGSASAAEFIELLKTLAVRLATTAPDASETPSSSPSPDAQQVTTGGAAPADVDALPAPVATLPVDRPAITLMHHRIGLTLLVAGVFLANYVETTIEASLHRRFGLGSAWGLRIADAFSALEGHLSFDSHDLSSWVAVYGYSAAYFFLLPALGLAMGVALWRRRDLTGYRVYCLAIAIDYVASLGFFLFFPVPERWSYPDSGAMLLSDRWSSTLINLVRPISALDNCFPSTHVSLTVVIVLVGYLAGVRMRNTIAVLGVPIVLSTFVLGIHWLPDIAAGLAVGTLSVGLARRISLASADTFHTLLPAAAVAR